MLADLRLAVRLLLRNPAFTAVAVATLAVGIGANAVIFSVVRAVLLEPLPFRDPARIVLVWERNIPRTRLTNVASPANFLAWRDQQHALEDLAAFSITTTIGVTGGSAAPDQVGAQLVTAQLFPVLGAEVLVGRTFTPDEDRPDNDATVISHRLWLRRFGGDRDIVGRPFTANGRARTIVGIMPPSFTLFDRTVDVWMPMGFDDAARQAGGRWLIPVARLKPGVTLSQAQAEMDTITARLAAEFPDRNAGWASTVMLLQEQLVGPVRLALGVLAGAVGFVLLIACANVGSLLLARATGRQRELAVRAALGAGRGRLIRQLLVESLLLAVLGGAAGLLLAYAGVNTLLAATAEQFPIPRLENAGLDWWVIGFTSLVSLLTIIVFGLTPAIFASRPDLNSALKDGARASGARGGRLRAAFVVVEVALALVLLAGAGLLIRSFAALLSVDPGFRPEHVLTMQISLPGSGKYSEDASRVQFFRELTARVERLPGVTAAGAVSFLPLTGLAAATSLELVGRPAPPKGQGPVADVRIVSGDYFRAMGIPLLKGRLFDEREGRERAAAAVINETMARQMWPGEDPIGKKFVLSWNPPVVTDEVIGVVGDVLHEGLDARIRPMVYLGHPRTTYRALTLTVRAAGDPAALTSAVVGQVRAMDPEQPVANVRTLDEVAARSLGQRRVVTLLLAIFAGAALLLAAVGLYGVLAYLVVQRTREIGVRMALGASRADVLWIVVGQATRLAGAGLALGFAGAWALTRVMRTLLFDVTPTDPVTLGAVAGGLACVAVLASAIPALRALRVDPVVALRCQ